MMKRFIAWLEKIERQRWQLRAKQACEKSYAHWKRIAHCQNISELIVEGYGSGDCALCAEFRRDNCSRCPVALMTGMPGCKGTPYMEFIDLACDYWLTFDNREPFPQKYYTAAYAEATFLMEVSINVINGDLKP